MTCEYQAELFVWDLINETDIKFQKFFPAIYNSIETSDRVIFFHEFFPKNLHDLVKDDFKALNIINQFNMAICLINQISVLQAHHVIHRNIAPINISVNLDKGVAYLTDFCSSIGFTQNQNNEIESFGAPLPNCLASFMPLEYHVARLNSQTDEDAILANQWLNQKTSDIWQLGITLGLLFFRTFLGIFKEENLTDDELQEKIMAWTNSDLQTKIPPKYKDSPVIPLILSMLDLDPSKRPTIMEVAENLAALAKKHHNLDLEVVKFD